MKFPCLAATSALALGLAACGPRTDQAASDTGNAAAATAADAGNAMAAGAGDAANALDTAVHPVPSAQAFVDTAAKSDAFEVAAAKLAATNAASPGVKAFAKKMIAGHTESTARIKAAGAKSTPPVIPDPALSDAQKEMLADLGRLKGKDFDTHYVAGQISAHEAALTLMKDYADKGDAAPLKTAAGEIAPAVQEHLAMARALEGK